MSREQKDKREQKAVDSAGELKIANERRVNALLDINNRYVRTARHLEQHKDLADLDRLKHTFKVQEQREAQMENLKNIISYGRHEEVNERKNIKRNLEFTEHYLQHHAPHMDEDTLEKTREKQEHREEQLRFLD